MEPAWNNHVVVVKVLACGFHVAHIEIQYHKLQHFG